LTLLQLEGLLDTFNRYFNLYVIYIDYFHYMQSLFQEHQPRGAGVYWRTSSSLMMGSCPVLVKEDLKMLRQPVAATPTALALRAEASTGVYWRTSSS